MTALDPREVMDPAAREAALFDRLRAQIVAARARAPGWARALAGVAVASLTDRAALARVPVLRKSDLSEMQAADPPFGGLVAHRPDLVFQSPGPIYEPGWVGRDWGRVARALRAAGLARGDVAINCFGYHLTPAGHMLEAGALALGLGVLPGGVGNAEAQARAAADLGVTAYLGTPDFLQTLLDKAVGLGRPLAITRAAVSGGPLFPAMRDAYDAAAVAVVQFYATADLGLIAYETAARDGMVVDEDVIVEIVAPGTGDPLPAGEVGEVVVSVLSADYPLIRFATGDLSAVLPGPCPTGRTGMRLRGWLGRADQAAKVRGMFVRPEQVADIARRHGLGRVRLTIAREGAADTLALAYVGRADAAAVEATAREVLRLRAQVRAVMELPNDGRVIDDTRKFD